MQDTLMTVAALLASVLLTEIIRRVVVARGLLDLPNERSSHVIPTPRGGGLAITAVTVICWALFMIGQPDSGLLLALTAGGVAVALIGYVDDRVGVRPAVRLAVHAGAALWALVCLGGLPPLQFGSATVDLGWIGDVLAVIGIVWMVNLFNFMDGIDGIAASEAVFIAAGGCLLALLCGASAVVPAAVVFAAACAGFLYWNWSPAKIFMGDVGSGFLGFAIAVLALAATRAHPALFFAWITLAAVFFADATVTLVRRVLRGKPAHQAHRSHAYQILARRWRSHQKVTVAVVAVNLAVLLPMACIAALRPSWAAAIAFCILIILGALAVSVGAGTEPA